MTWPTPLSVINISSDEDSDDRESSGSSPSHSIVFSHGSPLPVRGSRASLSVETTPDFYTGRSAFRSARRLLFEESENALVPTMRNLQDLELQPTTYGRTTPLSPPRDLNWEANQLIEVAPEIGTRSGSSQSLDSLNQSPRRLEFKVIAHSVQSLLTTLSQLELNESVMSFGVEQVLESRGVLGQRPDSTLILKTLGQNSGVDIEIRRLLSSMNFEEVSILDIYLDGWIVTRSLWKLKDPLQYLSPRQYGSPATSRLRPGTPVWMGRPTQR